MKVVRQQQQPQGDDRIIPLVMFDGGSFNHIWGTDMQQTGLLFNYQELSAPVKVDTAGGCITITHEADLTLGGHTFTGAINPFMKLSLLSEGDLYVNLNWKFGSEGGRKLVTPPSDTGMPEFFADMMGVLAFWPQKDLVAAMGEAPEVAYSLYTDKEVQLHQTKQTSISDFFPKVERGGDPPAMSGRSATPLKRCSPP